MGNNRIINLGPGGTYNESVKIGGNNIQGDFIQGSKVQHQNQSFTEEIAEIQSLLAGFQEENYSLDEAIKMAANELVAQSADSSEKKSRLVEFWKYLAVNGGIKAITGKVIELAIKSMSGM